MSIRNTLILLMAGLMAVHSDVAVAQTVTLQQALSRSLTSHPLLRAEAAATQTTERQASLDGLAPPLFIGADLENVAGTGSFSGTDSSEASLRLGKVFELGGKRDARQQLGSSAIERQRNVFEQRRLDVILETKRRFIKVMADQGKLIMADKDLDLATEVQKTVAYRVSRGRDTKADLAMAQLAVERADLAMEDALHELDSSKVALSVMWGERTPAFGKVAGDFDQLPDAQGLNALAARLDHSVNAQSYSLESNQLDAQRRLAVASGKPDVIASIGIRRLESYDDQALLFSVTLPIGLSDRSALNLSKNDAEQESLAARKEAAGIDSYQQLYARFRALDHARHETEKLRERMIPSAEQALTDIRRGYDDGRYSFLQIAEGRHVLFALQTQHLEATARYHTLFAEIERMTVTANENNP